MIPSPPAIIPQNELAKTNGLKRKSFKKLSHQPRRFLLPDIHRKWGKVATKTALRFVNQQRAGKPWDLIISTSPPETTHSVGYALSKRWDSLDR